MAQDLLVEGHWAMGPKEAARRIGAGLARRGSSLRPTALWQLSVDGVAVGDACADGLERGLGQATVIGPHVRTQWARVGVHGSDWRLPKAALGTNLVIVLGGHGALSLRLQAVHALATPRSALSNIGCLVASAALVFDHGGHTFAVPSLEHGSQLARVDAFANAVALGDPLPQPGRTLRVIGRVQEKGERVRSGLPAIPPLYPR